jgi:hypothetical protein
LHTWTGFGSVPYWNAFVGATEMHARVRFSMRASTTNNNTPSQGDWIR